MSVLLGKFREQFGERLLALAQHGVIDRRILEHPGVVGRDFRAAQQHDQFRPPLLQPLGDPQRPLDVPQ